MHHISCHPVCFNEYNFEHDRLAMFLDTIKFQHHGYALASCKIHGIHQTLGSYIVACYKTTKSDQFNHRNPTASFPNIVRFRTDAAIFSYWSDCDCLRSYCPLVKEQERFESHRSGGSEWHVSQLVLSCMFRAFIHVGLIQRQWPQRSYALCCQWLLLQG